MKYPTLGQTILLTIMWSIVVSLVAQVFSANLDGVKSLGHTLIIVWFVAGLIGEGNEGFKTQDLFRPRQLFADITGPDTTAA